MREERVRVKKSEMDDLVFDTERLDGLRRWLISLALGKLRDLFTAFEYLNRGS